MSLPIAIHPTDSGYYELKVFKLFRFVTRGSHTIGDANLCSMTVSCVSLLAAIPRLPLPGLTRSDWDMLVPSVSVTSDHSLPICGFSSTPSSSLRPLSMIMAKQLPYLSGFALHLARCNRSSQFFIYTGSVD